MYTSYYTRTPHARIHLSSHTPTTRPSPTLDTPLLFNNALYMHAAMLVRFVLRPSSFGASTLKPNAAVPVMAVPDVDGSLAGKSYYVTANAAAIRASFKFDAFNRFVKDSNERIFVQKPSPRELDTLVGSIRDNLQMRCMNLLHRHWNHNPDLCFVNPSLEHMDAVVSTYAGTDRERDTTRTVPANVGRNAHRARGRAGDDTNRKTDKVATAGTDDESSNPALQSFLLISSDSPNTQELVQNYQSTPLILNSFLRSPPSPASSSPSFSSPAKRRAHTATGSGPPSSTGQPRNKNQHSTIHRTDNNSNVQRGHGHGDGHAVEMGQDGNRTKHAHVHDITCLFTSPQLSQCLQPMKPIHRLQLVSQRVQTQQSFRHDELMKKKMKEQKKKAVQAKHKSTADQDQGQDQDGSRRKASEDRAEEGFSLRYNPHPEVPAGAVPRNTQGISHLLLSPSLYSLDLRTDMQRLLGFSDHLTDSV